MAIDLSKYKIQENQQNRIDLSKYRKQPVNIGERPFDVPVTPEQKVQRLANAQEQAKKYQLEAEAYKGNAGLPSLTPQANNIGITLPQAGQGGNKVFSETLKGIGSTLASSEIGLGKSLAKIYGNQSASYADTIGKLKQTQGQLLKLINDKESKGQDATNLKRAFNQNLAQLKEAQSGLAEESNLPTTGQVVGQIAGTVLDVATVGATRPATAGMKQTSSGLFTKQGIKNIAKGAGIGYGYDVSLGLQGARGEDRTGGKAFIPGLGTAIGGGIPTITEGVQSVKNRLAPDYSLNKTVTKNTQDLNKITANNSSLRKVIEKNKSKGYETLSDVANTDLLAGSVDNTGTIRTENAIAELNNIIKPAEAVISQNLKKEGRKLPLTFVEKKLKESVTNSSLEGKALKTALNSIDDEIAGYSLRADADGFISLDKIHDAKVNKYATINYLNPETKVGDKVIAKALKEIVEGNTKSVDVNKVNKELGRFYAMQSFLEKLDGKKVQGGKLGKYFAQTVGGMVGSHFGPIGTIIGAEAGGRIKGDILSRTLSGKTGKIPVRSQILEEAIQSGKPNEAILLPQSSKSFGNLKTNQTKTIIPTNSGISKTIPQKLNARNYISGHLEEAQDVLSNTPVDKLNELGGITALVERVKTNIVDGLQPYGQTAMADKISRIDTSKINNLYELQDEIDKILAGKSVIPKKK